MDQSERWLVTGSVDRTIRVWNVATGNLERTIAIPVGPGHVGKVYSVAISPDGTTVAAGGFTGYPHQELGQQIYLFDRATGQMTRRIGSLPSQAICLAFSPDGSKLAAALGACGVRLFNVQSGKVLAADSEYGDRSDCIIFLPDGRYVASCRDGGIRLYSRTGRLLSVIFRIGDQPGGIAPHPDGTSLAVGLINKPAVQIYNLQADRLDFLNYTDTRYIRGGNLESTTWSYSGERLYVAGKYFNGSEFPIVCYLTDEGAARRRNINVGAGSTVFSLIALREGDLIVVSGDARIGRFSKSGESRWVVRPAKIDFRGQQSLLSVSNDGLQVGFVYSENGSRGSPEDPNRKATFDLSALRITLGVGTDLAKPDQTSFSVSNWMKGGAPTIEGHRIYLDPGETSRSFAIHPDKEHIALGAEWSVRCLTRAGREVWSSPASGDTWATNISGDGRYVVTAHDDGSIRWRRFENGEEILALFAHADGRNWVTWTPDGVYAASPGSYGSLRWVINQGWASAPRQVRAAAIPQTRRPDAIRLVLPEGSLRSALAEVEVAKIKFAVERVFATRPDTRLHLLTVGISDTGHIHDSLRLKWAARDAEDIRDALEASQDALYVETFAQTLVDHDATRHGILQALQTIKEKIKSNDFVYIHFSGHARTIDSKLYLLTSNVTALDNTSIKESALSAIQLREEIALIAASAHVLATFDCCHSGTILDISDLRATLSQNAVTILTSCESTELSEESDDWQNGAFTEALLDAIGNSDSDKDGLVDIANLIPNISSRLTELTCGRQKLGVEHRLVGNILVATGN